MRRTYKEVGAVMGSDGSDLLQVPIDPPIIWSIPNAESLSGIGIQCKWRDSMRSTGLIVRDRSMDCIRPT